MSSNKIEILERAVKRQKLARTNAEKILEEKSLELFNISVELKKVNHKLEKLLEDKDSELKGVFENINDAYLVMRLNGNIVKMNDVAEDFFGFKLENNNENVIDLIYEEDYDYAISSFKELLKKGKFTDYVARIKTKRNQIKWVNISASSILDKKGNTLAAHGIVRDITDQRNKQLILDLVNETAKSILGKEDINDIARHVALNISNYLNTNDCVIYLVNNDNNALEQIAAIGEKIDETNSIIKKLVINIGEGIVGYVANSGVSEIIKDTSKDKRYILDDRKRFSEITVPIIYNQEIIGVIDAEHESKSFFTEEHLNTIESIANLVSLQLKSAINLKERKEAELKNTILLDKLSKSNDELKEYAHIVSHDLKSPLRSISALSTWIKMDNIDSFDKDSLQNFDDLDITIEKMDALISDILKFSSLDSSDEEKEKEKVDLNLLVDELTNILYIPENISINVLSKLPTYACDKIKIQQVFQNLISNAVKFIDKENGYINIDVENLNSYYKFKIEDNGIGIEERHFNKIFKIFQSLKQSKESTGIGLSIVKKIVNQYEGEIWLESQLNKGTTFYFTLKK